MRIGSTLLAAWLVLIFTLPTLGDDKAERAKFNGKWLVTAMTFDGNAVPADMFTKVPWEWIIDDEKVLSKRPGRGGATIHEEILDLAIDPAKDPKQLTLTDRKKKETNPGIYKFDGENMTICFAVDKAARPTDFTSEKGSKRVLLVFQKAK